MEAPGVRKGGRKTERESARANRESEREKSDKRERKIKEQEIKTARVSLNDPSKMSYITIKLSACNTCKSIIISKVSV